jgi:hypothetical protein
MAMSLALQDTIPVQNLVKKVNCIFDMPNSISDFCITCHKDNLLAIAMAESLKFTHRTNILRLNTIISEAECKRPSTSQETSRSSIFPQSYSLLTFSLNLWTMKASSDAAICYVAGDSY